MSTVDIPNGRLLVGTYGGTKQVSRRTGELVDNLFELTVVEPSAHEDYDDNFLSASFFATNRTGQSRPARDLDNLASQGLEIGDPIIVKVGEQRREGENGKVYFSLQVLAVHRHPNMADKRAATVTPVGKKEAAG